MTVDPVDPKRERLIAYLYGEMSASESETFRKQLAKDAELRGEFEELAGTREVLSGWKVPEPTPSFVFLHPETKPTRGRTTNWGSRLLGFLSGGGSRLAWGFASAAAAVALLAVLQIRVERLDHGFAFHWGGRPSAVEDRSSSRPGAPLGEEFAAAPRGVTSPAPEVVATSSDFSGAVSPELNRSKHSLVGSTGSQGGEYITRSEFEKLTEQMVGSVVDLLNEYGTEQNREMTGVMQAMYERISDRQSRDSEDLRRRMNSMGMSLLMRQTQSNSGEGMGVIAPAGHFDTELAEPNPVRPLEWKEEWR